MSDVTVNMTDNKLTITEAAQHFDVTERTIRRWIKSGQLMSERTNGQRLVLLDARTNACPNDRQMDNSLSVQLELENKHLCDQLQRADSEISHLRDQLAHRDEQIESVTDALNHAHQLAAMSQKQVQALTERLQLVEESYRRKWYHALMFWRSNA